MNRHGVFDVEFVADRGDGVLDQGDVRRGAAHIIGDKVVDTGAFGCIGGGHDAGCRAGHHGLGGFLVDETGRNHPAVTVHDEQVPGESFVAEFALQSVDISMKDRAYGRVDGSCHPAFVFAVLR